MGVFYCRFLGCVNCKREPYCNVSRDSLRPNLAVDGSYLNGWKYSKAVIQEIRLDGGFRPLPDCEFNAPGFIFDQNQVDFLLA